MRIAVGLKAHSGWAVLVAIGLSGKDIQVVDRRRIELIEPGATWAKQPYHAAEDLPAEEATQLVERGVEAAHRVADKEMRALVTRARKADQEIIGCAVLIGAPMPEWTAEQILSVHMRMHKAEGMLFPTALARAAEACKMKVLIIPEKNLSARAAESLELADAMGKITLLGKSVGAPWGKDQKAATLAAMIALAEDS